MDQNITIINEFEKLIKFIQSELDKSKANKDVKLSTANTFRLKQIKNIFAIIKKYPKELTLENLKDFKKYPGIGDGTINRINEILVTGKLK